MLQLRWDMQGNAGVAASTLLDVENYGVAESTLLHHMLATLEWWRW